MAGITQSINGMDEKCCQLFCASLSFNKPQDSEARMQSREHVRACGCPQPLSASSCSLKLGLINSAAELRSKSYHALNDT